MAFCGLCGFGQAQPSKLCFFGITEIDTHVYPEKEAPTLQGHKETTLHRQGKLASEFPNVIKMDKKWKLCAKVHHTCHSPMRTRVFCKQSIKHQQ
jgi:hypothetical protein